ncbi:hypothetical protein [Pseudogulbenkiania ferrooxidans]|uniref:Uncharacterized protein n=1 Tax=Pseudogulbenkiania ferrooxidans 2002 TaxID=279714 RepID=B9YYW0_9NEIS|nr:hypothetical protein [Pseudogulbenkiania ferrooxidans]EEG10313.1 conserved hypothetical protein [Pseudogulbenkiania ferrooxidans 2002]
MPHYKDQENRVHVLDSAEFEYLLPLGCVRIGDAEAAALCAPSMDQIRAASLAAINGRASELLANLSAAYPDGEVQSWAQQTREAEALAVDPGAATPMLTAIAASRGLTVEELAARVRAKVQAYAVASGRIIGQRQALEDTIHAVDLSAPDAAEQLGAIQWPA